MHAQIDGDVLIYACGFASDAAANAILKSKFADDEEGYNHYIEDNGKPHEPLNYALNGLNMKINAVCDAVDATRRTIWLSHPVNYREAIYPAYKANRDTSHRPYWYEEIKQYLLDKGAMYSNEGDEADDAMGITQIDLMKRRKGSVICTNDKDLDQIPGLHYNWSKTKIDLGVYEIDELDGLRFFYTQILSGDGTDNIPGLKVHTGRVATAGLKAPIQTMFTEGEMYEYVVKVYDGDKDFVHMIAPLLWIKRTNNPWSPPV